MDWSQAGNMPVSSAENQSINGDLYEKMLIFKIKIQNAGFVNICPRLGTNVSATHVCNYFDFENQLFFRIGLS